MLLSQTGSWQLAKDRALNDLSTEYDDWLDIKGAKVAKIPRVKAVNRNSIIFKRELSHFSVDNYVEDPVHCR